MRQAGAVLFERAAGRANTAVPTVNRTCYQPCLKGIHMETLNAICSRKSVRSYTGEGISAEALNKILLAANAAPIAMGKFDEVHLTTITNTEALDKIDAAAAALMGDPSRHALYGAPLLIMVSAKVPDDIKAANMAYSNAAIMVENMALEAVELGIGTCHIWGAIMAVRNDSQLTAELGIPQGFTPCCAVALGITEETYAVREVPANKISQNVVA